VDEGTARLLLEGRPGIGKTTVARRLLNLLQEAGVPVGGFTTAELRNRRAGLQPPPRHWAGSPDGLAAVARLCGLTDTTPRRTPVDDPGRGPRHSPFALR
jgi:NTPase